MAISYLFYAFSGQNDTPVGHGNFTAVNQTHSVQWDNIEFTNSLYYSVAAANAEIQVTETGVYDVLSTVSVTESDNVRGSYAIFDVELLTNTGPGSNFVVYTGANSNIAMFDTSNGSNDDSATVSTTVNTVLQLSGGDSIKEDVTLVYSRRTPGHYITPSKSTIKIKKIG
jgi:hypothetical protein